MLMPAGWPGMGEMGTAGIDWCIICSRYVGTILIKIPLAQLKDKVFNILGNTSPPPSPHLVRNCIECFTPRTWTSLPWIDMTCFVLAWQRRQVIQLMQVKTDFACKTCFIGPTCAFARSLTSCIGYWKLNWKCKWDYSVTLISSTTWKTGWNLLKQIRNTSLEGKQASDLLY